jgi:excisionase family DNA binding protein
MPRSRDTTWTGARQPRPADRGPTDFSAKNLVVFLRTRTGLRGSDRTQKSRRREEEHGARAPVQRGGTLANPGNFCQVLLELRHLPDEILTLPEVAQLLKVAEKTVYTMAQKGELPAFKVGGQWRFRRADLDAWIDAKTPSRGGRGGA